MSVGVEAPGAGAEKLLSAVVAVLTVQERIGSIEPNFKCNIHFYGALHENLTDWDNYQNSGFRFYVQRTLKI